MPAISRCIFCCVQVELNLHIFGYGHALLVEAMYLHYLAQLTGFVRCRKQSHLFLILHDQDLTLKLLGSLIQMVVT